MTKLEETGSHKQEFAIVHEKKTCPITSRFLVLVDRVYEFLIISQHLNDMKVDGLDIELGRDGTH